MEQKGLTHLYYGYGKGKTTAAFGLALRALGHGKRVAVVQFLKNRPSGEVTALERLGGVLILRGQAGSAFSRAMTDEERVKTLHIHNDNLQKALDAADAHDMLLLDEALDALQLGLLDEALLRRAVLEKPAHLELVITGHKREAWVAQAADYVTEMRKEKHPYDNDIAARAGIEF